MESVEGEELVAYLESNDFLKSAANSTRLVAKLKLAIQRKELYETHQILRTIYFRFIGAKEKINSLQNLLYHGACYLLRLKEENSGQDIATLFLETASKSLQNRLESSGSSSSSNYAEQGVLQSPGGHTILMAEASLANPSLAYHRDNKTIDLDICQKVAYIAINLPDRSEIGQSKFIADALRILNPKLINRSLLHDIMANMFWQNGDYVNSKYHYLRCASLENVQEIANLLVAHQNESAKVSEVDLFITQFILQFLCLQSPSDTPAGQASNQKGANAQSLNLTTPRKPRKTIKSIAQRIFSHYTMSHPLLSQAHVPFSSYPLLNFIHFIMSIMDDEQEAATFKMLCDIYKVTWTRDPNYNSYLTRIGTLYFGIVDQTKQRQGGFLNNILLSLLEGNDDDDGDQGGGERNGNNSFSSYDELD